MGHNTARSSSDNLPSSSQSSLSSCYQMKERRELQKDREKRGLGYLAAVGTVTRLLAVETAMRLLVSRQIGRRRVVFPAFGTRVPLSSLTLLANCRRRRRCRRLRVPGTRRQRGRPGVAASTSRPAVAHEERVVRVADGHAILERTGAPLSTTRRRRHPTAAAPAAAAGPSN